MKKKRKQKKKPKASPLEILAAVGSIISAIISVLEYFNIKP